MTGQEVVSKSKVVKVDSEESWDNFMTEAKNQGRPVFVHFTAAWCAPSVAMNHFFEEIAFSYQDILSLSVDVDEVKGAAAKMEVKAMPTFLLVKDGAQVHKLVGANPKEIKKMIDGFVHDILSSNNN